MAGILGVVVIGVILANSDQTQAIVLGLGGGALIAAIALSITLNYQGSGVVNFAAGAIAMYGGYVYYGLRVNGQLFLPPIPNPLAPIEGIAHLAGAASFSLPHIPVFITLAHPSQGTAAFGAAILAASGTIYAGDVTGAIQAMTKVAESFKPSPELAARYDEIYGRFRQACTRRGYGA